MFFQLYHFQIFSMFIFLIPTNRFLENRQNQSRPVFLVFAKNAQLGQFCKSYLEMSKGSGKQQCILHIKTKKCHEERETICHKKIGDKQLLWPWTLEISRHVLRSSLVPVTHASNKWRWIVKNSTNAVDRRRRVFCPGFTVFQPFR
jgi:hypothetical protein